MGECKQNGDILLDAHKLINGDRQNEYGKPSASFKRIAKLWSAYLGMEVSTQDVACMIVLLKLSREAHSHKRDNLIDAAGYIGLAGDMANTDICMDLCRK